MFDDVKPFTGEGLVKQEAAQTPQVLADVAAQREIAEVQGAMVIAKRFPRDQVKATDRIMVACQRPSLAESAIYSYARGGTDISGASIRLAETIAQQWGNMVFGIKELEQRLGESTIEAFAWDLETNTRQSKTFQVKHKRFTKKGSYDLSDPRDIYELVANQGARRLRACILGIVPGDIVEAAVNQCEATLKAKADTSPEALKKMLSAFESFGIDKSMIETRIQRKLESITAAQIVNLKKIYNSLKDGMSKATDWFEVVKDAIPEAAKSKKKSPQSSPAADTEQVDSNTQVESENATTPITDDQMDTITDLCHVKDMPLGAIFAACGIEPGSPLIGLSSEQAETVIAELSKL